MNMPSDPIYVRCHKPVPASVQGERRPGHWYCSLPTGHDGMHAAHESHQLDLGIAFTWYDHIIYEDIYEVQ